MRLEKSRSRCSVLFQSETMQRKTQGRNSHYIGNKEQKHICHNKSEKTMDSRKTLTGCGLSLFYSKKIYCAAAGTKNGKSVFRQPLVSFLIGKVENSENACFLLEWKCDFFKKCVLFPFEMGKGRKLAFLKNFPLYQKQGCKISKYFPIAMETGGRNRKNSIPIIPETKG